jgi:UrcA family protein
MLLAGAPALGGAQAPEEQPGPEIVVTAPRSVPLEVERSPYTGAPVLVATVKIPVRFGDLDLKDPASAERLRTRIRRVAQDACAQLDRLYPLSPDPNCIDHAIAGSRRAADALLAAAGG